MLSSYLRFSTHGGPKVFTAEELHRDGYRTITSVDFTDEERQKLYEILMGLVNDIAEFASPNALVHHVLLNPIFRGRTQAMIHKEIAAFVKNELDAYLEDQPDEDQAEATTVESDLIVPPPLATAHERPVCFVPGTTLSMCAIGDIIKVTVHNKRNGTKSIGCGRVISLEPLCVEYYAIDKKRLPPGEFLCTQVPQLGWDLVGIAILSRPH